MPTSANHRMLTLDDTQVKHQKVRELLATTLIEMAYQFTNYAHFWKFFPNKPQKLPSQLMVVADLASLAKHFLRVSDRHAWVTSVRISNLSFLAFVRTREDQQYASLVDELFRYSDSRISVCNGISPAEIRTSLLDAIAARDPHSLASVRYSKAQQAVWVEFGDRMSGHLNWSELGIDDVVDTLIPESATISGTGTTLDFLQKDGELFEIDAISIRALLDTSVRKQLATRESISYEQIGTRIRNARLAAGLTQTALHSRTGIDQALISKVERGHHQPRFDTLERIADCIGISVSDLLSGDRTGRLQMTRAKV